MIQTSRFSLLCALLLAASPLARSQITVLSNISANQAGGFSAGEIVAFDKTTDRLYVTSSGTNVHRVNIFDMSIPSAITATGTPINFSTTFGTAANMLSLSSVAVNSARGFGVASLIPTANTTTLGKVGFFELSTGNVIGTLDVGYHPDSVVFSPDGSKLIVVNEGEFNASSATNAPGSISVLDVSTITSGNLGSLTALTPITRDFTAGNLGAGVSLSGIRNSNIAAVGTSGTFISSVPDFTLPGNQDPNAIEPEYASVIGNKVYVSLQDNNALGEFDLVSNTWTKVTNLGTITQVIDASDQNNLGQTNNLIAINQTVKGLPMPDTVATYSVAGKTYIVTANEGDARVDDRDVSRFGDISGNDSMNPIIDTDAPSNFPLTQTGVRANEALGRLNVSRLDGDTDADGKIDDPTMIGTRSFSIWEVTLSGLSRVYDSGSFFETYISLYDTAGWVDSRSDDKGPEPEGLTLGVIDGRTYAFIGMERTASIFMFDVTDPLAPSFTGYNRIGTGDIPLRPEGMYFISAEDSPINEALLVVGFEGDGTVNSERVVVYSVVPEPSACALLGLSAAFLGFRRRRQGQG